MTNLKDTIYRVVAIQDDNRDYKYTPEAEMFAYLDTLVRPVVMTMTRVDTFRVVDKIVGQDTTMKDSIVTQEYLGFGPNNLYLRLFQEKLTQLYMTDDDRKERERLDFIFSIPERMSLRPVCSIPCRRNRYRRIGMCWNIRPETIHWLCGLKILPCIKRYLECYPFLLADR